MNSITHISQNSTVTLSIHNLVNYTHNEKLSCTVLYEGTQCKTPYIFTTQSKWNQKYTFAVHLPYIPMNIHILQEDNATPIAQLQLALSNYIDQAIHNDALDIPGTPYKLNVSVQYIHSEVQYIESYIKSMHNEISLFTPKKNNCINNLKKIASSFGIFSLFEDSRLNNLQLSLDQTIDIQSIILASPNKELLANEGCYDNINKPSMLYGIPLMSLICLCAYMVSMLKITQLYNVVVVMIVFNICINETIIRNYSLIRNLVLASFLWDVAWCYSYSGAYIVGYSESRMENGLRKISVFFSLIAFGLKAAVAHNIRKYYILNTDEANTR